MAEILIGGNNNTHLTMDAAMANRHGVISGATGTGKTVTLQVLAESFSAIGVPVFLSDIKGDLSGISAAGKHNPKIEERIKTIGLQSFQTKANPTAFWDLFAANGHPIRAAISDLGPLLFSNLLELNETQTGILYSAFRIADDHGLLLLDLKDLRALLIWMSDNAKQLKNDYGNISSASVGAIQRRLLVLQEQGAEHFFGEPALNLDDLCKTDFSGIGVISLLDATRLSTQAPRLYATFLLWLLSELFESFPEVGDLERPQLVVFFDEAHLLFDRAPQALIDKIEQIVRLIRSKGIGIFFISQSPLDIPEEILGQCGLKIQHALRAYTPKDKKTIKSVAETFRSNPALDTEAVITELVTGEALVSTLNSDGSPTPVERVLIRPPYSQIGPIEESTRFDLISRSPFKGRYEQAIDRESAYELLKQRAEQEPEAKSKATRSRRSNQSVSDAMLKSAARSIGSQIGRQLVRGILGSLLGGRR